MNQPIHDISNNLVYDNAYCCKFTNSFANVFSKNFTEIFQLTPRKHC